MADKKTKKPKVSDAELRARLETPLRDARLAQGEWAKSTNPSPQEQAEATAARLARAELQRRGVL